MARENLFKKLFNEWCSLGQISAAYEKFHKGIINSISLMENENIMNVKKKKKKSSRKNWGIKAGLTLFMEAVSLKKKKNLNGIIFQWNANFYPDENIFRWSIIIELS